MLQIAIYDDDSTFSSRIESLVQSESKAKGLRVSIEVFSDGNYLLKSIQQGNSYNIIFLDIEMNQMDGITTARKLRIIDPSVLIIYVSSFDDYLEELFEVEPFRFISKPIDVDKFKKYFNDACLRVQENDVFFQFSFNKEIQKIPLNDIVYFESRNRSIYIHLSDRSETYFYGKLNDIEKSIGSSRLIFLRIHQSFLVNYSYIKKVNFSYVTLHYQGNDMDLKISEDRQKKIKASIMAIAEQKLLG